MNRSLPQYEAREFGAPWGWGNRLTTAALLQVLIVIPVTVAQAPKHRSQPWAWVGVGLIWFILGLCALYSVRGYALRHGQLWIRRSFWWTRIPLTGLVSARVDPDALRGAVRLWGMAGFMAMVGWFYSKRLGRFRAWVTDSSRCVVLEFEDRTVVISPDDPHAFVRALGFESEPVRKQF